MISTHLTLETWRYADGRANTLEILLKKTVQIIIVRTLTQSWKALGSLTTNSVDKALVKLDIPKDPTSLGNTRRIVPWVRRPTTALAVDVAPILKALYVAY